MKLTRLLLVGLILSLSGYAIAEDVTPPQATPSIFFSVGKLDLLVPFSEVNVVYLYDIVGQRNMVGGETPLIQAWKLQGTVGAITSLDGMGSPFLGAHLALPNPLPNFVFLSTLKPGLFGGRDFNAGTWIGGLKVAASIF